VLRIPDERWELFQKHFPEEHCPDDRPGRKPSSARRVLEAVLWILITGAQLLAGYSCSDGLSGAAGCAGPVANGDSIVTFAAGAFSFTINATDQAGNTASRSDG
jgi:hypothetical protein